MSINWKQQAQLYKITYEKDDRYYIGITWGKDHSYLKRFEKHTKCKGGVHIKHLLENGAKPTDFFVELLEENELGVLYEKEKELSMLWPNGLNGNKGNAIVQTKEGSKKANDKRKECWSNKENRIKQSLKFGKISYDKRLERMKRKDWLKTLTKEEKDMIAYERNREKAFKCLNSKESIEKRKLTIENKSIEEKKEMNKKRSQSMKDYRTTESFTKKQRRIQKYNEKMSNEKQIERGKKISQTKKGKKTNQQKIMQDRYKNMSDEDFFEYIKDWNKTCRTRAMNLRNKKDIE